MRLPRKGRSVTLWWRAEGRAGLTVAGCLALSAAACTALDRAPRNLDVGRGTPVVPRTERFQRCLHFDEDKQVFFGDLHVHTSFSLDANLQGTRLDPGAAYRFARGQVVRLPPYDGRGLPTRPVRIDRPLDFAAVTDHAEFLGVIAACEDETNPSYDTLGCWFYRRYPDLSFLLLNAQNAATADRASYPGLCGYDGSRCRSEEFALWSIIRSEAERFYDRSPSCRFTTFVGYEWTGSPARGLYKKVQNLHRNVIFRNNIVPSLPIHYLDAPDVEELWRRLRDECFGTESGCDVLTISHNSNLSAGAMFSPTRVNGLPFDKRYARRRQIMEPLLEIYQHKGQSECVPGSTLADELCGFEVLPYDNLSSAKRNLIDEPNPRDYLRAALGEGLRYKRRLGVNPFRYGIIASTDNHLAMAGGVHEALFIGGGGAGESAEATGDNLAFPDRMYFGGGGLAAVWAEENSREALFRALRAKETYGTSGPRMAVRFFGGWGLPDDWCERPDRVRQAYERGVPMGGTLAWDPDNGARSPRFAFHAMSDPGTTKLPGTKLQRVQIVKGWLDRDDNDYRVRVVDVAGDPQLGVPTGVTDCEPPDVGFDSLCGTWVDDDYDPSEPAFYYARVLEVHTCRWTTRMCVAANYDCANPTRRIDEQCCDPRTGLAGPTCAGARCGPDRRDDPCCGTTVVEPMIQERAWTSPIWFEPSPFRTDLFDAPPDPLGPLPSRALPGSSTSTEGASQ